MLEKCGDSQPCLEREIQALREAQQDRRAPGRGERRSCASWGSTAGLAGSAAKPGRKLAAATGARCTITAAEAHSLALAGERSPVTHKGAATSLPAAVGPAQPHPSSLGLDQLSLLMEPLAGSGFTSRWLGCRHGHAWAAGTACRQGPTKAGLLRWQAAHTGGSTWLRLKLLAQSSSIHFAILKVVAPPSRSN